MAGQIQQSSGLWDLEHYLTERRKDIDGKYDYRPSRLTEVFGRLLYENRLGEEDLRGLREEKMKSKGSFSPTSLVFKHLQSDSWPPSRAQGLSFSSYCAPLCAPA
jgi:hypothetical protein